MDERDKAVHRLIRDHYQIGADSHDAAQAIQDIARLYGVAVAYLERGDFDEFVEERRGDPLTDAEWEEVNSFDSDFDEFMDSTPGPSGNVVTSEFMRYWLDRHGIAGPDGKEWGNW